MASLVAVAERLSATSPFTPFVRENEVHASDAHDVNVDGERPDGGLFTIPNGMTAYRLGASIRIASMLTKGERGIFPHALGMTASDMEGRLAFLLDKYFPGLNIGSSEIGKVGDQVIDVAAAIAVSQAAIRAPRMSRAARLAAALVLSFEASKSGWYAKQAIEDGGIFEGDPLKMDSTRVSKIATAERLTGLSISVSTNELPEGTIKNVAGYVGLAFALAGVARGVYAVWGPGPKSYKTLLKERKQQDGRA